MLQSTITGFSLCEIIRRRWFFVVVVVVVVVAFFFCARVFAMALK